VRGASKVRAPSGGVTDGRVIPEKTAWLPLELEAVHLSHRGVYFGTPFHSALFVLQLVSPGPKNFLRSGPASGHKYPNSGV